MSMKKISEYTVEERNKYIVGLRKQGKTVKAIAGILNIHNISLKPASIYCILNKMHGKRKKINVSLPPDLPCMQYATEFPGNICNQDRCYLAYKCPISIEGRENEE